jgi:hypothetical protein
MLAKLENYSARSNATQSSGGLPLKVIIPVSLAVIAFIGVIVVVIVSKRKQGRKKIIE